MTARIRQHRWLALLMALALFAGACGRDDGESTTNAGDAGDAGDEEEGSGDAAVAASPGITDDSVKIGASYPLSGPASAYGTIAGSVEACFDWTNEEGGIEFGDGKTRTVDFVVYDDSYDAAKIVQNAKRLVEQDEVFALINPLGTPTNTAIVDYMNEQEVPHVFLATGASKWGSDIETWPWTIGWQPAYPTEAAIYVTFLEETMPEAKVAVLFQNDDFGKDYLSGFKAALEGTDIEIIAEESYETTDPSVDSQVVNLAATDADVFFNITTPKFAAQAIKKIGETRWEPIHLLASVSGSTSSVLEPAGLENAEGIYSAQYLKEPSDPTWEDDEAMIQYKELGEQYGDFNIEDPFGLFGFAICDTVTQTLEQMEEPTRESLMEAVRNLDLEVDLLLPGIKVKTSPEDGFPIEAMQLRQFNDGGWEAIGDVVDYEGETPIPGE